MDQIQFFIDQQTPSRFLTQTSKDELLAYQVILLPQIQCQFHPLLMFTQSVDYKKHEYPNYFDCLFTINLQ